MGLLLVVQYAIAWSMPEIHRGTQLETQINLHFVVGTLILLLHAGRLT